MALATKCPHCNTIFRVAADQLKLRGGIVRCGSCQEVFDGNAALVEPATKPTTVIPEVPAVVAPAVAPAAEPVAPVISSYVHGSAVDFELDFAEEVAPAPLAAPAVWRTGGSTHPTPEEQAEAAVARAFAAVTSPAAVEKAPLPWESEPSGDAEIPAPAVPLPVTGNDTPAIEARQQTALADDATAPNDDAVQPSPEAHADAGETAPANVKAQVPDDAKPAADAPMAADEAHTDTEHAAPAVEEAQLPDDDASPAADDAHTGAEAAEPAAVETQLPGDGALLTANEAHTDSEHAAPATLEAQLPGNGASLTTDEAHSDTEDTAPAAVEAELSGEDAALQAADAHADAGEAHPDTDATAPTAVEAHRVGGDAAQPAVAEPQPAGQALAPVEVPQTDESAVLAADDSVSGAHESVQPAETASDPFAAPDPDFVPAFLRARPAPSEAEPAPADKPHPDGRIEPTLDTPQEHIVVAALDESHHFEDIPPVEQPAAETAPRAADEPWSLAEPEAPRDDTALHAVAAVNTDVPDDGASVQDDEAASEGEDPASAEDRAPDREAAEARMRALAGVDEAPNEDLDHSDLSFVKRHDRSQKYGRAMKVIMAFGMPLLLGGLVLQAATTFRDTLAASYPQLKPALAALCQPLGCQVGLPTQLDALSIEQGELASMAADTFSFSTVLRNQSKTVQSWPHIELTLNDNADKPVVRRVFAPREYLPAATEADKGFLPRSEQSIKLYFELKELKASGYHIAIFYP